MSKYKFTVYFSNKQFHNFRKTSTPKKFDFSIVDTDDLKAIQNNHKTEWDF